ncbi:McrBC 5-methylcytosine restriction system component-like protein [Carbonactinospora thermoautotrophica]|uniref:McrBC 5-methylcytosine restriction system component-like protein n=1 Tax=Carbonactinospora thermoautotrophica TaxID=1469144 RepID=A0A132MV87_9ACTN|nr:hypothetical protein [Carbonactinospora thermoautotrophica]KWX01818.1 McrBC 5-methylcytosine restriction system component-like protein [Carbonactinospora thermoautotrophica]
MIRLREGEPAEHELPAATAAALATSGIVKVTPGPRPGLWRLVAHRLVGAARVAGVELRIAPKTPVDRLFFLLGYARRPHGSRPEQVEAGERPELLPALAHAFVRAADRALQQGVLQGYREAEEALPVVRGRIRLADQVRRRYGFPLPVEVSYDDHTVDIAENRLLRAAAERLLRLPGLPAVTRTGLHHVLARLAGVGRITPGQPPPAWRPTRLNARYHVALGLAELVLRGASYELDDGTRLRVDGLLVDMAIVFEDFVSIALAEALRPHGGYPKFQDRAHHLDHGRRVPLRPDLVWYRDATPVGVVDAKYKVEDGAGVANADLYQMLAYCTVLGLPRGHLVCVRGDGEPQRYAVRGCGVEIVQHALDLAVPPDDLLAQVREIASQVVAGR